MTFDLFGHHPLQELSVTNFDVKAGPFREMAHYDLEAHLHERRLEHLRQQRHLLPDFRVIPLVIGLRIIRPIKHIERIWIPKLITILCLPSYAVI